VTHIVELRKEPRPSNPAPEAQSGRTQQIPSAHISSYILKFLGLNAGKLPTST